MKRYPEYKDCNVEGISSIPVHWSLIPNRTIFCERIERGFEDLKLLSVTIANGVIPQTDYTMKKDTSSLNKSNYKRVKPGDLAYNKMRMWQGAVGLSQLEGIVSPAYIILQPKEKCYSKYYSFLFKTPEYIAEFDKGSYGICDDMNSLRYNDFKIINSLYPPVREQKQISKYLDYKTHLIDTLIEKKQKQIELHKEQRAAIIHQAVTKGLNPDVKMKDSGIEWLGEVPEHWVIGKLNYYADLITQGPNPNYDLGTPDEKHKVIKTKDLYDDVVHYNKADNISQETFDNHIKSQLFPGDLLIAIVGKGSIGKVNIFNPLLNDTMYIFSRAIGLVKPSKDKLMPYFLNFLFRSAYGKEIVNFGIDGSTGQEIIKTSYLKNVKIVIPPKKEQSEIISFLNAKTTLHQSMLDTIERKIEKLKEYRTTLISNAVTGKIDVRDEAIP